MVTQNVQNKPKEFLNLVGDKKHQFEKVGRFKSTSLPPKFYTLHL